MDFPSATKELEAAQGAVVVVVDAAAAACELAEVDNHLVGAASVEAAAVAACIVDVAGDPVQEAVRAYCPACLEVHQDSDR